MRRTPSLVITAVLSVVLAACTSAGASSSPSAAPSEAASVAPSPDATLAPTPDACARENLTLVTPGTLTIGTDNPAFPPYFDFSDPAVDPWELGDPTNGRGFESAFAYALADQLGFSATEVAWTVVPFANSFAPGPKAFDLDINQVSYTPARAEAVDLSDGYYFVNQAVVALGGTPAASATTIAELKGYKFGAQVGTTSYDTIQTTIAPTSETAVFDTNDAAVEALKNGQIDGLVVDLPTAFFVTAVQVEGGVIVGQFPPAPDAEHFSAVLAKDSLLTPCVNAAIAELKSAGTLAAITQQWLSDKVSAPVLQP